MAFCKRSNFGEKLLKIYLKKYMSIYPLTPEEERIEKISQLLIKLKKAHEIYLKMNEEQKAKLFDNCEFIFDQLVGFGYERTFVETLLISGKEFLDSFFKEEKNLGTYGAAKVIFGK